VQLGYCESLLRFEMAECCLFRGRYGSVCGLCACLFRGRYGSVCLCTELVSGTTFAAKFIRLRPSQRAEFRQEIEVMNLLRHPKILLLWDAFESARELILVMEQ